MMSMASLSVLHASQAPFASFLTSTTRFAGAFPAKVPSLPRCRRPSRAAALKSPRGFGPAPASRKAGKKQRKRRGGGGDDEDEEDDEEDEEEGDVGYEDDGTIPEVVTNRMMRRMGVSVGAPLAVGLLFFPFFYYLKVVGKVDVPTWVPFLVSFFFFGTALLGISYGIVSSSWDPLREGSLLGWNEAQRNWPVFWQSLWSGRGDDRSGRRGGDSRKRAPCPFGVPPLEAPFAGVGSHRPRRHSQLSSPPVIPAAFPAGVPSQRSWHSLSSSPPVFPTVVPSPFAGWSI